MKQIANDAHKFTLCLRLKQHYGVLIYQDKTVQFSEDAQLSAIRFDETLPAAEFAWLAEVQCAVHWDAAHADWRLRHGQDTFNCTVNDMLLACDADILLQAGDVIELNMLRLEVLAANTVSTKVRAMPAVAINAIAAADNIPVAPEESPTFALADPASNDCNDRRQKPIEILTDLLMDPFDMVPPMIDGFSIENNSQYRVSKPAVVVALKQQYVLTIADPAALQPRQPTNQRAIGNNSPTKTVAHLVKKGKRHRSAEDIVSGTLEMRDIYDLWEMDVADRYQTDIRTTHILQQFAGALMRNTKRIHIPDLTRREHHAVSPDSHFSLERAIPHKDTNDTDKNKGS